MFICLVIISCSYSEIKDVIQTFFSFFGLLQLHLLILRDKNLTNMFVVSISHCSVTFISWKSNERIITKYIFQELENAVTLISKASFCSENSCLFLIVLRIWFHHRFLVLLLYVRFDEVGNKLQ